MEEKGVTVTGGSCNQTMVKHVYVQLCHQPPCCLCAGYRVCSKTGGFCCEQSS
jgi:hypothetical protein